MIRANNVLEYLEKKLDEEHINYVRTTLEKIHMYESIDTLPIKIQYSCEAFDIYPYKDSYDDMDKMMVNELINVCNTAILKDYSLPMIRANYGVGILPSLFGLKCSIINDNLPWVEHVDGIDEIQKIIEKGVPDINSSLGSKTLDTHNYYNDLLSQYPLCKKLIPIYHPDLQGPFDVAHLIWGPDIYYALYDNPQLVHNLLKLVTDTYIEFMKKTKMTINDTYDEYCYHWGTLYKGNVVLRDDSPVNLSEDMYLEFVKPYDERILSEFGSGSIHYCGRADQWIFNMLECEKLNTLNFGQPPNLVFSFDFLEKIYDSMKRKKISNIDYILDKELLHMLKATRFKEGITYLVQANSLDEAKQLLTYSNIS